MLFKSIYVSALISSFVINNVAALNSIDHLPYCVQGVLGRLGGFPATCDEANAAGAAVVAECPDDAATFLSDKLIVAFTGCLCAEEGDTKNHLCAMDDCAETYCQTAFMCTEDALNDFKSGSPRAKRKLIADDYCECAVDVCIADDGGDSGNSCNDWEGVCGAPSSRIFERRPEWDTYECEGECDFGQCCHTTCDERNLDKSGFHLEYEGTCGDLSLTNGQCYGGVCTQENCCAKLCGDGAEGDWRCKAGDRFPPNQDCYRTGDGGWDCSQETCCRQNYMCDAVCDDFDAVCEHKIMEYLVGKGLEENPCGDPNDGGLKVNDADCILLAKYALTNLHECSACTHCMSCASGMDLDECSNFEKAGESCEEDGIPCFGDYECTDTDADEMMERRKLFGSFAKKKNRDPMGRGFICTKD